MKDGERPDPGAPDSCAGSGSDGAHVEVQDGAVLEPVHPHVRLLQGSTASEVLARISTGDPLGLWELSQERILQRIVFLAPGRVFRRTLARVAWGAIADPRCGRPHVHGWLVARVDESLRDLLREDLEAVRRGLPFDSEDEDYYRSIGELLGCAPEPAHTACTAFNALDERTREIFYTVAIEGRAIEMCVGLGFGPRAFVEERLQEVLRLFAAARGEHSE